MNHPTPAHQLQPAPRRALPAAMLEALQARFGPRCSTALAVRQQHGRDESPFDVDPPDCVVFAESNEDVAFVLAQAQAHGVPVIPMVRAPRWRGICWPCRAG